MSYGQPSGPMSSGGAISTRHGVDMSCDNTATPELICIWWPVLLALTTNLAAPSICLTIHLVLPSMTCHTFYTHFISTQLLLSYFVYDSVIDT